MDQIIERVLNYVGTLYMFEWLVGLSFVRSSFKKAVKVGIQENLCSDHIYQIMQNCVGNPHDLGK